MANFIIENRKYEDLTGNTFTGLTDAQFRIMIMDYLLGKDWYVGGPCDQAQVNEIALDEILTKYSKQYRQEQKQYKKDKEKLKELKQELAQLKEGYFKK